MQALAAKHSVSVSQVCLRWVLQKGAVMAVGLGSNASVMPEYSKENLTFWQEARGYRTAPDRMAAATHGRPRKPSG